MMDDVAAKLKMDPVEFILKNMTRKFTRRNAVFTNYTLDECIRRGVEAFELEEALAPGRALTPGRSSAAPVSRSWRFRSGLGRSSATIRLDASGELHGACRRHRRRRRREDHDGR